MDVSLKFIESVGGSRMGDVEVHMGGDGSMMSREARITLKSP